MRGLKRAFVSLADSSPSPANVRSRHSLRSPCCFFTLPSPFSSFVIGPRAPRSRRGKQVFTAAQDLPASGPGEANESARSVQLRRAKLLFRCGIRMMELGVDDGRLAAHFAAGGAAQQRKMRSSLVSAMKNLSIVYMAEDRVVDNREWLSRAAALYRKEFLVGLTARVVAPPPAAAGEQQQDEAEQKNAYLAASSAASLAASSTKHRRNVLTMYKTLLSGCALTTSQDLALMNQYATSMAALDPGNDVHAANAASAIEAMRRGYGQLQEGKAGPCRFKRVVESEENEGKEGGGGGGGGGGSGKGGIRGGCARYSIRPFKGDLSFDARMRVVDIHRQCGDDVEQGDLIATLINLDKGAAEPLVSPTKGTIRFVTASPKGSVVSAHLTTEMHGVDGRAVAALIPVPT